MNKKFLFEEKNVGAIYTTNPEYIKKKEEYDKLYTRYTYTAMFAICNAIIAVIYTFWVNIVCGYNLRQLALFNIAIMVVTIVLFIVFLVQDHKLDKLNYVKEFKKTEEYLKQMKILRMKKREKVELIFDIIDRINKVKGKRQDKIDAILKTMNKR